MENKPLPDERQALTVRLYILISLMLAVPVLFWPLAFGRGYLELLDPVQAYDMWRFGLVGMVLVVAVADTMLVCAGRHASLGLGAAWIAGSYVSVFLSMQLPPRMGIYMLACLLAIYAGRSAWHLWSGKRSWWLWPAWTRDMLVASGVFAWFL